MVVVRRFVVVQALLLWQGGFLFYAAIVVPVGTDELGSAFAQGKITARVHGRSTPRSFSPTAAASAGALASPSAREQAPSIIPR